MSGHGVGTSQEKILIRINMRGAVSTFSHKNSIRKADRERLFLDARFIYPART